MLLPLFLMIRIGAPKQRLEWFEGLIKLYRSQSECVGHDKEAG